MPPVIEGLARFALSISQQIVLLVVICTGIVVIVSSAEQLLVLSLVATYLATAVLLASQATPELAFAAALLGIFVSLMMQLTATERLQGTSSSAMPLAFRLVLVLLLVWVAWSVGLFQRPVNTSRFASTWLVLSALLALATSTDAFKVGTALLFVLAAGLLYYATSAAETSLLVLGLISVASFVVSLTASHLSLATPPRADAA